MTIERHSENLLENIPAALAEEVFDVLAFFVFVLVFVFSEVGSEQCLDDRILTAILVILSEQAKPG